MTEGKNRIMILVRSLTRVYVTAVFNFRFGTLVS